jgi:hypothetical protein
MGKFRRKYPKKQIEVLNTNGVQVVLTPPDSRAKSNFTDGEVKTIVSVLAGLSDADMQKFVEHTAQGGDEPAGTFTIRGGSFGGNPFAGLSGIDLSGLKDRRPREQPAPQPAPRPAPQPAPKPAPQPSSVTVGLDSKTGKVYRNVVGLIVVENGQQVIKWL